MKYGSEKNMMGYNQGDMKPHVEDYQAKDSQYSQRDMNKTTEYVERRDKFQGKESSGIKKQAYHGRYE